MSGYIIYTNNDDPPSNPVWDVLRFRFPYKAMCGEYPGGRRLGVFSTLSGARRAVRQHRSRKCRHSGGITTVEYL